MKALVLAAGLGDRMRPVTDRIPKPLLPIANRPVMGYILEHLARHGFTDVIANLHYRGEQIVDCFGAGRAQGVNLVYSYEDQLSGIAGGLRRCRSFFGDETFLVIGADDLTDMDLTELVSRHRQAEAVASIGLVEVEETSQFGIVVTNGEGRIQRFVEKPKGPAPGNTANTQIYLFEPEIFDFIPPDGVCDLGFHVFPALVEAKAPFYGFHLPGYWRDIGTIGDYLAAQPDVMLGKVWARLEACEVSPGVWMGEGCEVASGVKLTSPVMLGDGCRVGGSAQLGEGTVIGAGVEVPERASLEHVVVWAGASLPAGAALSRLVVTPEGIVRAVAQ